MKDALNMTYGFGCHCRNCEFAESRHNGGFGGKHCKRGILRDHEIRYGSFCSEGVPKQDEKEGESNGI